MILAVLLGVYVLVAVATAVLGRRLGSRVCWLGAVAPAATAAWTTGLLITGPSPAPSLEVAWVPRLDLMLTFRVDGVAALMSLLVAGIGALVFVYCAGYSRSLDGPGRFTATLSAFAAAMLGLVWADNVWTLFVFWELTSITSFLLVGHKDTDPVARAAARRALMVTVGGGLALLAGLVVLVDGVGGASLDELRPIEGTTATVAAALVLLAAATKSAQVPFHVWLPGAMAAPTPVSAYLHSATMVKAGVLLVAITAPALSAVGLWTPLGTTLGLASMIWGGIGALRHHDAKLVLAWGTVSQLGLMIALLSLDDPKATFAAIALLVAHAVFKAALFMVVGEVDVRTGTRDITRLGGLWRSMPLAALAAGVSAASMAGLPLVLGFPAKEAAIEAVLGMTRSHLLVAVTVVVGSVLTVAYTLRLMIGLFGPGPPTPTAPPRPALTAPSVVLAVLSVAAFAVVEPVTGIVRAAASEILPDAGAYSLLRWPGLTAALGVSAGIVAAGAVLGVWLWRRGQIVAPRALGAGVVDHGLDQVVVVARRIAGRIQHGSLPVYLVTMAGCAVAAIVPLALAVDPAVLYAWDHILQPVFAAVAVAAAVGAAAMTRSRLGAALSLGAVGVGVTGLFVVHGAPDLALTQLLVETVIVVAFVVGLGSLTTDFPPTGQVWQRTRVLASVLTGLGVSAALTASAAAPAGVPAAAVTAAAAVTEGGGNNVVNVILTDMRALDTLGEVVVLVVVSVGLLALTRTRGHDDRRTEEGAI